MKKIKLLIVSILLLSLVVGCAAPKDENVIRVGASPSPHAEILEFAAEILKEEGITLEIVEFTDYILPNTALDAGDLDANFFQHQPYLDQFNEDHGTDIVMLGAVHFEPLGLYPGRFSSLSEIEEKAVIAVTNDATNEARSLALIESLGWIKLKEDAGLNATLIDIVENPYNLEFFEIEAAQLTNVLADVDYAVINGNFAVDADILDTVLVSEPKDGVGAMTFANGLCVNAEDENDPNLLRLLEVLQSEEVSNFIKESYKDLFVSIN